MFESGIPMSGISLNISVTEFVIAETVKLLFTGTIALTGDNANVDPKSTILAAAKTIFDGEWIVTSANRNEDSSGIETVVYALNVRVKDREISQVKANIKDVNKPGIKFVQTGTDYTPTPAQLEEANKVLRGKIYTRANEEISILDATLKQGEGEWLVGQIEFGQQAVSKMLRTESVMYNGAQRGLAAAASAGGGAAEEDAGITQKVELHAQVVFAKKIYARV